MLFLFLAEAVADAEQREADDPDETRERHHESAGTLCAEDHQLESANGLSKGMFTLQYSPQANLRHDGRAKFGWSHRPHQSYYTSSSLSHIKGKSILMACWANMPCLLGRTLLSTKNFS